MKQYKALSMPEQIELQEKVATLQQSLTEVYGELISTKKLIREMEMKELWRTNPDAMGDKS